MPPLKGSHWSPMSGWWIIISVEDTSNPGEIYEAFPRLTKLAEWKAGAGAVDWLEELVGTGSAEMILDCGGYPNRYEVSVKYLLPLLQCTLPALSELDSLLDEESVWDLAIDPTLLARQMPNDILVVEAWDQS